LTSFVAFFPSFCSSCVDDGVVYHVSTHWRRFIKRTVGNLYVQRFEIDHYQDLTFIENHMTEDQSMTNSDQVE